MTHSLRALRQTLVEVSRQSVTIFITLAKVMVPIIIIVKVLTPFGVIDAVGVALQPVMGMIGLPGYTALVWASAMIGNLYTGLITLALLWPTAPLSVAEVSALSLMMLIAHNLPVEVAVARRVGASIVFTLCWRLVMAIIGAALVMVVAHGLGWWQQPAEWRIVLTADTLTTEQSLIAWLWQETQRMMTIFGIIWLLLLLLRTLRALQIEYLIARAGAPLLRRIGIGQRGVNVTMIGMLLGIAYGGGLLIDAAKRKEVAGTDAFFAMALLGLSHAVIEDTLIMFVSGASLVIIVGFRVLLSVTAVWLLTQVVGKLPLQWQHRLYLAE